MMSINIARVSTKPQAKEEHFSIEAQFRMMRECCERRGITILEERVEPGRSAYTPDLRKLPVLHQAVLDIEAGKANALVLHETTRLARNEQLGHHLMDRLHAVGASFINSLIDIDYTTPEGRSFFNQEVSMSAYTSRKTSQHAKKGKLEQFLQGLQVGQIPWGYQAQLGGDAKPNRKLPAVIVPEEAAHLRRAFDDYRLGRSPNDIAREWNALGLKPRSVKGIERFEDQTVRNMLQNPYYMGDVTHLGQRRKGQHEPLLTEEEWTAAQLPRERQVRAKLPPLLAQGVARCFRCDHKLYPLRPKRRCGPQPDGRYSYYLEPSDGRNRDCPDGGEVWTSAEPDAVIDGLMRELCMSPDWLQFVVDEAAKLPPEADQRRKELQESIRRLQREYLAQRLEEDEYNELRQDFADELALLPVIQHDLVQAARQMRGFGELWESASAETRNQSCKLVFAELLFDVRGRRIVSLKPHDEFRPIFSLRASVYDSSTSPGPGSP